MDEYKDWKASDEEISRRMVLGNYDKLIEVKRIIKKENSQKTGILDLAAYDVQDLTIISHMHWLVKLDCSENKISEFDCLEKLKNLEILDCSGNQLSSLNLHNSRKLQEIYCNYNKITNIYGLENLKELKILHCSNNNIGNLEGIENLENLEEFYCINNSINFKELSCELNFGKLRILDLSQNNIANIDFVKRFKGLEELICYNCNVANIPEEFLSKSWGDNCLPRLNSYWKDLAWGAEKLDQYKIIILGNGSVGKTQIARWLCQENYDDEIKSTHGIEIKKCSLDFIGLSKKFEARIWDFGGQDIYHGTHALFMRTRAIFIICWNKEYEANNNGNYPLQYWHNYVKQLGKKDSPIIIVETQCDDGFPSSIRHHVKGANISSLYFSAKTNTNSDKFKKAIEEAILIVKAQNEDKEIGPGAKEIIKNIEYWVKEDELKNIHECKHIKITIKEFEDICANNKKVSNPSHLLEFLHDIGLVFYVDYHQTREIIIHQKWALNAMYTILDRDNNFYNIKKSRGRFSLNDLKESWKEYSESEQKLFISLMLQCEIIFKYIENNRGQQVYIAPNLLPERDDDIDMHIKASWNNSEQHHEETINFNLMHDGLMRSIICNIGDKAKFNAEYWKSGIFFYDKEYNAPCLIEFKPKLDIWRGFIIIKTQRDKGIALAQKIKKFIIMQAERQGLKAKSCISRSYHSDESRELNPSKDPYKKDICYISYAHKDTSTTKKIKEITSQNEEAVHEFYNSLKRENINIIIDFKDLRGGDSIYEFMHKMGNGGRVCVFFSEKYFKSPYCMLEFAYLYQSCGIHIHKIREKASYFSFDNINIHDSNFRRKIIDYWKSQNGNLLPNNEKERLLNIKNFTKEGLINALSYLGEAKEYEGIEVFTKAMIEKFKNSPC